MCFSFLRYSCTGTDLLDVFFFFHLHANFVAHSLATALPLRKKAATKCVTFVNGAVIHKRPLLLLLFIRFQVISMHQHLHANSNTISLSLIFYQFTWSTVYSYQNYTFSRRNWCELIISFVICCLFQLLSVSVLLYYYYFVDVFVGCCCCIWTYFVSQCDDLDSIHVDLTVVSRCNRMKCWKYSIG